jgi:hypothetical protein
MKLIWHVGEPDLYWLDDSGNVVKRIQVSNAVRNAENGRRSLENPEDVVMTTPDNGEPPAPYMPIGFPAGHWRVTGVYPRSSAYLAPFFIATNAWRDTEAWALSPAGDYDKPSGRIVRDSGFGIHHAEGTSTTLGCLRVIDRDAQIDLAGAIDAELKAGRQVIFDVIA